MFFPILPEISVFCKNQKASGGKGGHFFSASTEKNTYLVHLCVEINAPFTRPPSAVIAFIS